MVLSEFGTHMGTQLLFLNRQLYNHKCNTQPLKKPCRSSGRHQPPPESTLPCSAPLPLHSQFFPQGNPYHQLAPEITETTQLLSSSDLHTFPVFLFF